MSSKRRIDMLRESRMGCGLTAVWITGGQAPRFDGSVWHVPKLELMAQLQSLFEREELRIARRLRESGTLVRELLDMRTGRGVSGRVRIGADGAGEHDDLALAVALAVWPQRRAAVGHQGSGFYSASGAGLVGEGAECEGEAWGGPWESGSCFSISAWRVARSSAHNLTSRHRSMKTTR